MKNSQVRVQKGQKTADLATLRWDCAMLLERKRRQIVAEVSKSLRESLKLPTSSNLPDPSITALSHKQIDVLFRQIITAVRENNFDNIPKLFVANHNEVLDHAKGLVPLLTKLSLMGDAIRKSIIEEQASSRVSMLYFVDKLWGKLTTESVVYFGKLRRVGLKNMTKRYEQAKELNEAIVESSPIGILVTDREGYITSVNSAQEIASDRKREVVLGKRLYVDYAKRAGEKFLAAFQRAIELGETSYFKRQKYKNTDGRLQYLDLMLAPVKDSQGRISGCVQIMREVTDVFELEQKLLKQNRALGSKVKELQDAYAYIGRVNRQLSSLIDINNTLSTHDSLEKILDFIVRSAAMLCKARLTTLRRLENGQLKLLAQYGLDSKEVKNLTNVLLDKSVIGRVIQENRQLLIVDLKAGQFMYKELNALKLKSLVSVPLKTRGKIMGVLSIHLPEKRDFSTLELNFLVALANQAALAMELEKAIAPIKAKRGQTTKRQSKKFAAEEILNKEFSSRD